MGYKNIVSISKTIWELNNIKVSVFGGNGSGILSFLYQPLALKEFKGPIRSTVGEGLIISAVRLLFFLAILPLFRR
jgi:hypothetical protein